MSVCSSVYLPVSVCVCVFVCTQAVACSCGGQGRVSNSVERVVASVSCLTDIFPSILTLVLLEE